jgi:glycosyltransferase involved in cell wall biosynthesis
LKIAYFINDYPKVSHSFIRREIQSLERRGIDVQRIALRGWVGTLPDCDDQVERSKTRYVLRAGAWGLIGPVLCVLLRSPVRFLASLRLSVKMSADSDRLLIYHLAYFAEACWLVRWLRSFSISHVHAHFGTNSTDVTMLAHALGGPSYSFTVHGPEEFLRPVGLRTKIERSAFVVAISNFGRSQLYLWTAYLAWSKIHVVRCGLEERFYANAPLGPSVAQRLVCVGRLVESKGQLLLLKAAARLAGNGHDFELVLAGDGPARTTIEALIETYGLTRAVRVTGWISSNQVREEILASRALVLPSFSEGLPVVIMEAMALRRPVLATYVAGVPELVTHGETGWLFPAGSVDELCCAITQCLSSSAIELQRMGQAAHERVVARHSIDTEAQKLDELLRSAASMP